MAIYRNKPKTNKPKTHCRKISTILAIKPSSSGNISLIVKNISYSSFKLSPHAKNGGVYPRRTYFMQYRYTTAVSNTEFQSFGEKKFFFSVLYGISLKV